MAWLSCSSPARSASTKIPPISCATSTRSAGGADRDGFCDAGTKVYAAGRDLKDPMLSLVYADFSNFAPTILTSGTRDLLLSNTVRVHRKLRDGGVDSFLPVFEGQSHAHYLRDDSAPETKAAFAEIAGFFNSHLGK